MNFGSGGSLAAALLLGCIVLGAILCLLLGLADVNCWCVGMPVFTRLAEMDVYIYWCLFEGDVCIIEASDVELAGYYRVVGETPRRCASSIFRLSSCLLRLLLRPNSWLLSTSHEAYYY